MLQRVRRGYIAAVETLCGLLDHVPTYDDGHWYRMGDWGCLWGLSLHAVNMDERWGTGVWQPVD